MCMCVSVPGCPSVSKDVHIPHGGHPCMRIHACMHLGACGCAAGSGHPCLCECGRGYLRTHIFVDVRLLYRCLCFCSQVVASLVDSSLHLGRADSKKLVTV